jgi:hypothetical protein
MTFTGDSGARDLARLGSFMAHTCAQVVCALALSFLCFGCSAPPGTYSASINDTLVGCCGTTEGGRYTFQLLLRTNPEWPVVAVFIQDTRGGIAELVKGPLYDGDQWYRLDAVAPLRRAVYVHCALVRNGVREYWYTRVELETNGVLSSIGANVLSVADGSSVEDAGWQRHQAPSEISLVMCQWDVEIEEEVERVVFTGHLSDFGSEASILLMPIARNRAVNYVVTQIEADLRGMLEIHHSSGTKKVIPDVALERIVRFPLAVDIDEE